MATGAVYRSKLAVSAVGTTAQGTITLTRAIGTLSSAAIGSLHLSYGSAGTLAARVVRAGFGSFVGTVFAPRVRATVGSFARFAGSVGAGRVLFGTIGVARIPGLDASKTISGTFAAARVAGAGTVPSTRIGTMGAGKVTYGTMGVLRLPTLPSLVGTLGATKYAGSQPIAFNVNTKAASGTLALARSQLLPNLVGTLGASKYAGSQPIAFNVNTKATSGTIGVVRLPSLASAYIGTLGVARIPGLDASKTISGTFAAARVAGAGTVPSTRIGSHQASKVTYGSFARARVLQVVGTHVNGSFSGNQVKARYVVWPSAFPNGTYFPWANYLFRGGSPPALGAGQFHVAFVTKVAGSARYYVARNAVPDASGSVAPLGSIFLFGV